MSIKQPMGIAYPLKPLAEPRSACYAGCESAAGEVFGCIPHARGAYAAAGNENYCGNLLIWQSSVTLLPLLPPELAANLFRATQADEKIRRDNIRGRNKANQVHYDVGVTVRNTIKQLGGTMPENLPAPRKSIKQIEREQKQKQLPES